MASEITIVKIPSEKVFAKEFAALERVSMSTVRRWTTGDNPCLPIEPRVIKPAVSVLAAWCVSFMRSGRKNRFVKHWVIPVFKSSLVRDSL